MMPMLLNKTDRMMLTDLVLARLARQKPAGCCTNEDLRLAIDQESAELVSGGDFVFRDGALTRRPPGGHECDAGWIAVPDPILGDHIQARCPECSRRQPC
jgi:hypothetical protein